MNDDHDPVERAFNSRRSPVLTLRCKNCRALIGYVFNSDEGLLVVVQASFSPPSTEWKAKISALKDDGKRPVAKAMQAAGELVRELLRDRSDRLFRHRCSPDARSIEWSVIEQKIAANEAEARI